VKEREDDDIRRVAVRERAREDTFKVVIAVVAALLLTNTIIIVYFVHPAFNPPDDDGDVNEPDPEGDWLVAAEPLNITQDEVWQDLDITLERPVVVADNATLDIRDSNIRVLLEDLIFWLRPAFKVESGSRLTLTSSTIEVYQDPRLEASVFGPYNRPDHNIPLITRVVNLDNAVDPVLHMDVQWPWDPTQLAIGVLPSNDSELILLDRFMPEAGNSSDWTHLEVGLADFVGTQPWVVIWYDIYPTAPALIGNLEVLDGDEWPEGDAFPTGHPRKDGWAMSRFYDLPNIQRTDFSQYNLKGLEHTWQPLIDNMGDVVMTASHLVEPPGMGRKASSEISKEAINPELVRTVDQVGAHGGHVNVVGGTLEVLDGSTFTNTPITGNDIEILFDNSDIRGDHDLVSLHNASGGFTDCTFTTDPLAPDHPFNENHYRFLWGLALERTFFTGMGSHMDPDFVVRDCEFVGTPLAIDLSRADVSVTGNAFRNIPGLAIWDHRSIGVGDWDALQRTNTFDSMGRYYYLRSGIADVEFIHSGINDTDIRVNSGTRINTGTDLNMPFGGALKNFHQNRARYIVPETLVTRTGEVQTSERVRAHIGWEDESAYFTIPKGTPQMIIDLEELFAPEPIDESQRAPMDLWVFKPSYGPDVYELLVAITDLQDLRVVEPTMRFTVDDVIVEAVNLTDDMVFDDQLYVWENLTLVPGWQDIQVSVWGKEWLGGEDYSVDPVEISTLSIPMLIMSTGLEVEPWMPLEAYYVVVPRGRSVTIEHLQPRTGDDHDVFLQGWEGSSISIDCGGLDKETDIEFHHSSELSVEVYNASVRDLSVNEDGSYAWKGIASGTTRVHDVVADILGVDGINRDITISRTRADYYLAVSTDGTSNVVIEDSVLSEADGHIFMTFGNVTLRNCTMSSDWSRGLFIEPTMANVTIKECTVINSNILIYFDNYFWAAPGLIEITDCHFSGDEAVLYIGWHLNHVDSYDIDPDHVPVINGTISGNTFNGPNTHVVLSHGQFGNLWGTNVLEDGARTHAFFITRLQVIPPDGTPFWGAYNFIEREGVITDWPFQVYRWVELDGEILWDITDNPRTGIDPPTLDVLLYSKYGNYRIVRGFGHVVPNADNDEATYPVYPSYQEVLMQNLIYWPPLEGWE